MHHSPLQLCGIAVAIAVTCLAFPLFTANAQTVIADSAAEFSGVQGQDDWTYGYRNLTMDGGTRATYDAANDFIAFAGGDGQGAWDGATQMWTGTAWDLNTAAAGPWTFIEGTGGHPNGTNSAPNEEHWAIRRWTAPGSDLAGPTLLQINWFVSKSANNTAGAGVTGRLHHNGAVVDTTALEGSDTTGITKASFITVDVGDIIDLALTPVGLGGDTGDGSDSSSWNMVITTVVDTDMDGLPDGWEELFFPGDLSQLMTGGDFDMDGLPDEGELGNGTNPTLADSDGDLYEDDEEVAAGTNPNDPNSLPAGLADSRDDFSGVDGQDGWRWGYRNFTVDGGATDYDPAVFIPFPVDGTNTRNSMNFWNGSAYDWADDNGNINPPWTALGRETTHPNGTNNVDEHWTIRRWTAGGLGGETPVRIIWHTRKTNLNGDVSLEGVTGSIHLNGAEQDTQTILPNDGTGFVRTYYAHLDDGDIVDQVLTPEGVSSRGDGADGSANWMRLDDRLPVVPRQPDGRYFIPNNAIDSEPDGLADFWEEEFFPGDLTQLASGQDFDGDGALDEEEQAASTNPTLVDTDGDGRSDGDELHVEPFTDPFLLDTDGDCFGDRHELATGYDPSDPNSNPSASGNAIADSVADFPQNGEPNPQGVNSWTYGYYNTTADGEPPANANFIPFPTDGSIDRSGLNHWNGTRFDWFNDPVNPAGNEHNPPWTEISSGEGHPNGDNNIEVHWAVRRWEATVQERTPLALHYHLRKTNPNGGNGTSAIILQNGQPLDSIEVEFNDSEGVKSWYFINAEPEDLIEIALSPRGPNGGDGDGADGSGFWMIVDTTIPENPAQPDGTPFVPGAAEPLRIVSFFYDDVFAELTLEWTSKSNKEYQIEESTDLENWDFIGPVILPQKGGRTEHTLSGVAGPPSYFRVLELDP